MAEAPRTSMIARSGRPIGGVLAMVVVLGGGMAGLSYRSQLPSFARLDPAASPTMATSDGSAASDIATAADIATKAHEDLLIAEQGEASAPSQDVATYAAAPEPSPPDNQSAPSIPDAAMPAPAALASRLVPLPVPRPPEFRTGRAASPTPRLAARRAPQVAAAPPEDTRSFFEKLLGLERSDPPRLAYAALETKPVDTVFRRALSVVPNAGTGGVAIYDIRAKVVTLPNGEKLEAHSGLGDSIDDPNHVHVRMKGPTPVGTYDITEREQPFHGVRALRLNPVGGPEAVHGRVGLLAHTYMLGANGASNGCVSFRDYEKFLQAYLRGDVQRLVVVAGG